MIKTTPLPDGTEKSGFLTTLYGGITYSVHVSVAKILIEGGSALLADKPKKINGGKK